MRFVPASLAILPVALAITFVPSRASAVGYDEAHASPKAAIGCGLLGAELVLGVEAAVGVQSPWAYVGGGIVGAGGGAVGGYFIDQEDNPRTSMLLLAAGLTLAIPTTVAVLSATSYEPPADYLEDKPPPDEPVADPPQPAAPTPGAAPASGTAPTGANGGAKRREHRVAVLPPLRLTPPAIIDLSPDMLALRVPALEIRESFSQKEMLMFGVKQETEFHVPVFNVAF
ncbi:MAG TPA: hypothetical protein VF103_11915 [Polyangiaceae bacterium]